MMCKNTTFSLFYDRLIKKRNPGIMPPSIEIESLRDMLYKRIFFPLYSISI